jgi:hypothetical protein
MRRSPATRASAHRTPNTGAGWGGSVEWPLGLRMKGSLMTRGCCPSCRLRFTPAVAAHLDACPGCGEPPLSIEGAEQLIGFRLAGPDDLIEPAAVAVAVAMPVPGVPGDDRGR